MTQRPPKVIETADASKLYKELDRWCAKRPASLGASRLRAIVSLAHGAALEIDEVLELTLEDVEDLHDDSPWLGLVVPSKKRTKQLAVVPATSLEALRQWLVLHAAERKLRIAPKKTVTRAVPLFAFFSPLRRPTATIIQRDFKRLQLGAGLAANYRFNDLRHDALWRFAQRCPDPRMVAAYGRIGRAESALRFLPRLGVVGLTELAKLAERPR